MNELAYQLTASYGTLIKVYALLAIVTFVPLFWISAPYGRFTRPGFGPNIEAVYGWMIMEMPSALAMPFFFLVADEPLTAVSACFAAMWMAHYLHRTFYYPLERRDARSRMPLMLVFLAIVFNVINGTANGWFVFGLQDYELTWLLEPRFGLGLAIFITGMAINIHSDKVLLKLKRQGKGYQVPEEGLHRYVASPNYLGELIEWIGWAIATWSVAGLLFAVYTFANLAPRARSNLKWYRETFPDYPRTRRALIPGLW